MSSDQVSEEPTPEEREANSRKLRKQVKFLESQPDPFPLRKIATRDVRVPMPEGIREKLLAKSPKAQD